MSALSDAQHDALKQAYDLLGEHFEHSLIAIATTVGKDEKEEATQVFWRGGRVAAIGLAYESQRRIGMVTPNESEP